MDRIILCVERAKRAPLEQLHWIDEFLVFPELNQRDVLDFTPEGREYYKRWFTRYGLDVALMERFSTFFQAMRQLKLIRALEAQGARGESLSRAPTGANDETGAKVLRFGRRLLPTRTSASAR
jgi:hypothetical protein